MLVTSVPPAPKLGSNRIKRVALFVRSDREQLAALVERVDSGELTVDVSHTLPLSELAAVHASGEAGELRGKVLLTP